MDTNNAAAGKWHPIEGFLFGVAMVSAGKPWAGGNDTHPTPFPPHVGLFSNSLLSTRRHKYLMKV